MFMKLRRIPQIKKLLLNNSYIETFISQINNDSFLLFPGYLLFVLEFYKINKFYYKVVKRRK